MMIAAIVRQMAAIEATVKSEIHIGISLLLALSTIRHPVSHKRRVSRFVPEKFHDFSWIAESNRTVTPDQLSPSCSPCHGTRGYFRPPRGPAGSGEPSAMPAD